jgi:hypothetical protein
MEDDTYRFGEFSMSPRERRLFRNGESVLLPPKAFDAMYLLVQTCRDRRSNHHSDVDDLKVVRGNRGCSVCPRQGRLSAPGSSVRARVVCPRQGRLSAPGSSPPGSKTGE